MTNSINRNQLKKLRTQTKHDFLHTFFDDPNIYNEVEINGYHLVNQWNGNTNRFEVAIYTKESFKKKQDYLVKQQQLNQELF